MKIRFLPNFYHRQLPTPIALRILFSNSNRLTNSVFQTTSLRRPCPANTLPSCIKRTLQPAFSCIVRCVPASVFVPCLQTLFFLLNPLFSSSPAPSTSASPCIHRMFGLIPCALSQLLLLITIVAAFVVALLWYASHPVSSSAVTAHSLLMSLRTLRRTQTTVGWLLKTAKKGKLVRMHPPHFFNPHPSSTFHRFCRCQ